MRFSLLAGMCALLAVLTVLAGGARAGESEEAIRLVVQNQVKRSYTEEEEEALQN